MFRKILSVTAISVVMMAALAGTAHAQYVPGEPGIIVTPGSVSVDGKIAVQGSGCPRSSVVTISVGDVVVATTTTSASDGTGSFDVTGIVLPPEIVPGEYTIHARCGTLDLTSALTVAAPTTTTTAATGNLPVTGSDSGLLVKMGIALVAAGGFVLLATRRRRATL